MREDDASTRAVLTLCASELEIVEANARGERARSGGEVRAMYTAVGVAAGAGAAWALCR
jgi:hypothetical protein